MLTRPDGFIVPLTYGLKASWYVNLQASPATCVGRDAIPVGNPTLVPTTAVAQKRPFPSRFLLWLEGTDQCVRITNLATVAD